ncbi:MAG: hypothetical protein COX77_00420 [Candidatus Komeilibacteria bacterium CG_4_10_14_0_2_um_filter_37_10]|uniref:Uncharacterized protein n=1 Tax=Candidatus Komeilibacteria bacterium CG_4_10_14_0_2_um_filter_37_10 TaxID=1974470 RepID=A0A2M7VGL2_9BACT|nr:MAG: hypothetical protein COX77_00420 [Candidatus Komeilibacteria bacterium CG_4_10_14_0_2_um_filter_37_10]
MIYYWHHKEKKRGMLALISILIIGTVVLFVVLSVGWQSTSELQGSYWISQSLMTKELAQAGIEDVLIRLKKNWVNYNYTLDINGNSSIITVSTNGSQATITSFSTIDKNQYTIVATVNNTFNIINWQEN